MELLPPNSNEPNRLSAQEHYQSVLSVIDRERTEGPDPYWRAQFERWQHHLSTDTELPKTLFLYSQANRDDTYPIIARKLFSTVQQFVMPLPDTPGASVESHPSRDPNYPDGYYLPEAWDPAFATHKNELSRMQWRLSLSKDLQSNVIPRFPASRVAAQLFGLNDLSIYSGGASFGAIEKMEKLYRPGRYHLPLTVAVGQLASESGWDWRHSDQYTADYCDLLNRDYRVRRIIATDIDPPLDPLTASYARSNCYRAPEFMKRKYRNFVDRMLVQQVAGMEFTRGHFGDFTDKNHVAEVRKHYPWWFDLPQRKVQFIATQYIHAKHPDALKQADENALALSGDDGLIFWMDFCKRDDQGNLAFRQDDWKPGDFNLYALDRQNEAVGRQHIFSFSDGRTSQIAPGEELQRRIDRNGGRLAVGMMRDRSLAP